MRFPDYVTAAGATAIYPDAGTGSLAALNYLTLGLFGESAETLEKELDGDYDGMVAELGDVAWYLARLHSELDLAAQEPTSGREHGVADLVVAAGRVGELIKKAIRDDGGLLSPERRARLEGCVADVAAAWVAVNHRYALVPGATLERNHAKLTSRSARGVLAGSGDHR